MNGHGKYYQFEKLKGSLVGLAKHDIVRRFTDDTPSVLRMPHSIETTSKPDVTVEPM